MDKKDFFLRAMQAECYRWKGWVIDAFALTPIRTEAQPPSEPYPWALWRQADGYHFLNPLTGSVEMLEGTVLDKPAFRFFDAIDLEKKDCPNLTGPVKGTTYGNLLYNWIVLVWPFGAKIPFMTGEIKIAAIERIVELMRDLPKAGEPRDPKAIYIDEYLKYQQAAHYTEGFTQLCVPSATPINVVTDPRIAQRRAELLSEHRNTLNDPVTVVKITNELIAMDKAWVGKDPEGGFYTNPGKQFDVARKKMFLLQGIEAGFSDNPEGDLIESSLNDGWDISKLPAMSNSLREGSFNRGAQTALGGEIVKTLLRIAQNSTVSEDDCGSKIGLPVFIRDKAIAKRYIDRHYLEKGKAIYIDEAEADKLVGKTVLIRSPVYCKTDGYNYCSTCIGKEIGSTPKAIGVYVSDVGSVFLQAFLKAMHGRSASTAVYDIDVALT